MQLEVSTVSRKTEQWWLAPGAIDVITDEDIRRSGVQTLPDALRLATGVHVAQSSTRWTAIGIRGFNVLSSNKINVRLDGRNLFTPFFSGVLWDAQDTLMEDLDRIEVLRGPGGALWGPYSLNGFVQILTKPAWQTQGLLATTSVGTEMHGAAVRYGGQWSPSTFFRGYAKYREMKSTRNAAGQRVADSTDLAQTGFRTDTRGARDTLLTFQGDLYTNKGTPNENPFQDQVWGGNIAGHWRRLLAADADVQVSTYYEHTYRRYAGPFEEWRDTVSGSAKYRWAAGAHEAQVGADAVFSWDTITGSAVNIISPPSRRYTTFALFAHDTITLVPRTWALTVGAQAEHSGFSSWNFQPTLRLLWRPAEHTTAWAAISRAVRTPVRLDEDLVSRPGGLLAFEGNDDLKPETVAAFEVGVRRKFGERLAIDLSAFHNAYNDVRSYESRTGPEREFPWTFKNSLNARGTGVEATVLMEPAAGIFVKTGYWYMDLDLTRDPGSRDFMNAVFEANDPRHVGFVTTRLTFPYGFEVDATLRHASRLRQPVARGYTTADVRLGWAISDRWIVDVIGRNLLDRQHVEFVTPNSSNEELARSFTARATWRF